MSKDYQGPSEPQATSGRDADATQCAASDLKLLLEQIATQIGQSEQRQAHALSEMLSRLENLGGQAKSYRDRVPAEFLPAFERIEDGVAQLADRIAATRDAHREHGHGLSAVAQQAPAAAAVTVPAQAAAAAPVAVEPVADRDTGAWDQAAADSLFAHYQAADAGFAGPTPDPEQDPGHTPWGADTTAQGYAVQPQWLDDRFAEIARIVEQQVSRLGPDASLAGLGQRFDSFEKRFGSALDQVARREQLQGLGQLEGHISELARQFDDARLQLGRLDGIEQTLAAVVDRLADPRFDDILARGSHPEADIEPLISAAVEQIADRLREAREETPHHDLAHLADAAAERVATRFADLAPVAGDSRSDDLGAVRELLEQFISDRREGDEQTAAMLDTMQQAMIRVLDRVDAIEQASQSRSAPQEYVREQVRFGLDQAGAAASGAHKAAEAAEPMTRDARARIAASEPARGRSAGPMEDEEGPGAPFDPAPREATPPPSASAKPFVAVSGGASIERLRQDFIADAQRAKLKASSSAEAPSAGVPDKAPLRRPRTPAADALDDAAPLSRPRMPLEADPAPASGPRTGLLRSPSRKLLVSAIVLMIAVPGILLLAQKRAGKPMATPAAANIETPADTIQKLAAPSPATPETAGDVTRPAMDATARSGEGETARGTLEPTSGSDQPSSDERAAPSADEPPPQTNYHSSQSAAPTRAMRDAAAAIAATPGGGVPPGIAVARPAKSPTLAQIDRLYQRQSMAEMSTQLGAAQVGATPAALIPEFMYENAPDRAAGTVPAAVAANAPLAVKKALDLPPATIGPLSLRMAAAKGDPSAEFEVGARFAEGKGPQQSFADAAVWYQKSAGRGFAQSQYRLATLYERGLGVAQDIGRAKVWYARAAESGNIKAMHNLAVLSAGSTAKTPDYATAAKNFQAAAERGLADSQFNLAVLYEGGLGVAKDMKLAYKWFAIAAKSGDEEATRRRDELERELSAPELQEARALVANFRAVAADRLANDAIVAGEAWKKRARENGEI